jgi:hypothetical protein
MDILELVDDLYEEFVSELRGELAEHARDLPRALRLAPTKDAPWRAAFTHEVTLGAPALFAEAMPQVSVLLVREAVRAHMLAVIDAFGMDRIEDGQITVTSEVHGVLERVRAARNHSLSRVHPFDAIDPDTSATAADFVTGQAISRERQILGTGLPVDFDAYEGISVAKQSAGLFASVALARAAGWNEGQRRAVRRTLEAIAMGLQLHDDVVDWEDDQSRDGSWVVALMKGGMGEAEATRGGNLRSQVLRSGVLLGLLRRARRHMRSAALRARTLGAWRLANWASERADRLATLASAESKSAGYAIRVHALSAWAAEVLT